MSDARPRADVPPRRRSTGVRRMAELLDAAATVFAGRGYEPATMAEIAQRAGARIGSLYYFFPSKEAVAHALVTRYEQVVEADYASFNAGHRSVADLADFIVDAIVRHGDATRALVALLDARDGPASGRSAVHGWAEGLISRTLRLRSPGLADAEARGIAAVLLANAKTMAAFSDDPGTPPGARGELRVMNRSYLVGRLRSE